ncbi:MAG: hypothetical protein M3Z56_07930, partial [Bacteroidota bacterium]|nr:hypothetical protein [Bacteroidota bacterium]
TVSYPDMVVYHYYPVRGLRIEVSMVVQSSTATFWDVKMINESGREMQFSIAPFIRQKKGVFKNIRINGRAGEIFFDHTDMPDNWTITHHVPYEDSIRNLFRIIGIPDAAALSNNPLVNDGIFKDSIGDSAHMVAFRKDFLLAPQQSESIRIFRIVQPSKQFPASMIRKADSLEHAPVENYKRANEQLFSRAPLPPFTDSASMLLYWSACNMMRQVFYPAEGNLKHNYYVFSREPHWGWGHGGQVFHESISMLAYAYIDPVSAMNSQRVFAERQHPNGYINYRTGAYLDEVIEENGELTSSAPWYSWLNWEVYQISRDTAFLREMYQSSKRFYNFYTSHRDKDHDGLCEWGGEAILESVRDALVAVWDQVGNPAEFESLDLNCMLVMEAKSLEKMARILHLKSEADGWKRDYQKRSALINKTFWDPVQHFYFNVDKHTHTFTYKNKDDLKRKEIIGFLPLWAGIANKMQAAYLVKHLTDTASFWRRYGVPSLAANDPYYNPKGYWNGPVWIQWNYLIERGLLDYGYKKVAVEMVHKIVDNMTGVLRYDHELWEFYDPDSIWGGYHRTYIWAGIINRMMMDLKQK